MTEAPKPRAQRGRPPKDAILRGRIVAVDGPNVKPSKPNNKVFTVSIKVLGREDGTLSPEYLEKLSLLRTYFTDSGPGAKSTEILEEFLRGKAGVELSADKTYQAAFQEAVGLEITFKADYEPSREYTKSDGTVVPAKFKEDGTPVEYLRVGSIFFLKKKAA